MKLNLEKPIVFFDLETTGTDVVHDRIVEFSYIKVYPDGSEETRVQRINPGKHIPEEASAIHGIYDKDVEGSPFFVDVAKEFAAILDGSDIAGFNSNRFDVPLLAEEFSRSNLNVDLHNHRFIDVQNIYHKLERRTLSAAYRFYLGKDLEQAHSAMADTRATYQVLMAQLDYYPNQLKNDVGFLSDFSQMTHNVDFAGRMIYDEQGDIIFNFGKYKGRKVAEVLQRERGYYEWMRQSDFAADTKLVLDRIQSALK